MRTRRRGRSDDVELGRLPLALAALAGGRRAVGSALDGAVKPDLVAELARRAGQDAEVAVTRVGARSAAGWLVDHLPGTVGEPAGVVGERSRRAAIVELRRRGLTLRAIANKLGVGVQTVAVALANVEDLPGWVVAANGRRVPARRDHVGPDLRGVEDPVAAAAALYEAGASVRAVARALGVGRVRARTLIVGVGPAGQCGGGRRRSTLVGMTTDDDEDSPPYDAIENLVLNQIRTLRMMIDATQLGDRAAITEALRNLADRYPVNPSVQSAPAPATTG